MTKERAYIAAQEESDNKQLYLFKSGKFYHALNGAAFAVHRLTHYRVIRKKRRDGDVFLLGFPIEQFSDVKEKMKAKGMEVESLDPDSTTVLFSGGDPTVDLSIVEEEVDKMPDADAKKEAATKSPPSKGGKQQEQKEPSAAERIVEELLHTDVAMLTLRNKACNR